MISSLNPDFLVLDFVTPETLADLNQLLFTGEGFESRSIFMDSLGGQASIRNTSQPIGGTNDLSSTMVLPATSSFTLEFLNENPEFRNVAFVFNDAGINIFDNAAEISDDGLRDLNVAVEDFEGISNFGTPVSFNVERQEIEIVERVEFTSVVEPEFFQTVVTAEEPLFTQTVQEQFFVVVYFDSQAEADNFEAAFEKLDASETGEKDYEQLQELLKQFESLDFKTDNEDEALDVNKIRQIFEKADLDLDGDDEMWQKAFQEWLKKKDFDDESPEVPRGVYKIIEVDNGKAIIQGDDVDRRFVPESDSKSQAEDYPFEVPSDEIKGAEPDEDLLQLTPAVNSENEGASVQPVSGRMTRWAAMLEGQNLAADQELNSVSNPVELVQSGALPNIGGGAIAATSAIGLLGIVVQRNAISNRTAEDEIEDFSKAKSRQPERNVFSKAARFARRHQQNFARW